jgi:GTP-binding protein
MLAFFEEAPQHFVTSSELHTGRDEILGFISNINQSFEVPDYDEEYYNK